MTQDQIKAIAEEAAHDYAKMCSVDIEGYESIRLAYLAGVEEILNRLSNRYCIVGREKVMEMYNSLKTPDNPLVDPKPTGVARIVLTTLFGTSMFNQNEE